MKAWNYNRYRASLELNGKFFAFVTPDLKRALSTTNERKLMKSLLKAERKKNRERV